MKKQFTIRIDMENAAFDDGANGTTELYNILEKIQAILPMMKATPGEWGFFHDTNGNLAGQWHFKRTRRA